MKQNVRIAKELVKLAKQLISSYWKYDPQSGEQIYIHTNDLKKLYNMILKNELNEQEKQQAIQMMMDNYDYVLLSDLIYHKQVNPDQSKKIILYLIGYISNNYNSECNWELIRLLNFTELTNDQKTSILNALVDNDYINQYISYNFNQKFLKKPECVKIILDRAIYNSNYELLYRLIANIGNLLNKEQRKKAIFTLMEQNRMKKLNQLMEWNLLTNEQKLFIQENQYI